MLEVVFGALMVFLMRVADVSLGTVRQIFAVRGHGVIAAAIGFIEVTIFILAISRVLASISENMLYVFAYSGGFAVGTMVGVWFEHVIGLGNRMIRVITVRQNDAVVHNLRKHGFGVTQIDGRGKDGKVYLLMSAVRRKRVPEFLQILKKHAPQAVYTVEELRFSHGGVLDLARKGK